MPNKGLRKASLGLKSGFRIEGLERQNKTLLKKVSTLTRNGRARFLVVRDSGRARFACRRCTERGQKDPSGGIIAPLERRIKLESTAPATRNKLRVVFVNPMFLFRFYSWEVLKTRVLATLVAVSAFGGLDAVCSKVQVSVGNIHKVPRLSRETGFNMGLRMY